MSLASRISFASAFACAAVLAVPSPATDVNPQPQAPPFPGHNRLFIPRTDKAPAIDGVIGVDEWAGAALISGLARYNGGFSSEVLPEEQATWFYFMYDDENLYVAMRSRNFPPGSQLKTDCKDLKDQLSVVMLDHFELQLSRTDEPAAALKKHFYKFMGNHRGSLYDQRAQPSVGQEGIEWDAGAMVKNQFSDKEWDMEMSIPFKNMSEESAPEDWETWIMWIVRAYNCQSSDFFMWGGKDWLSWDLMPRVTFHSKLVSARLEQLGEPLAGNLDAVIGLVNHSDSKQKVNVNITAKDAAKEIFYFSKTVEMEPKSKASVPVKKPDLPVTPDGKTSLTITAWLDGSAPAAAKKGKRRGDDTPEPPGPKVIYQQFITLVPKDEKYVTANFKHVKDYRDAKLDYTWDAAYYASVGVVRAKVNLDIDGLDEKYQKAESWNLKIVDAAGKAGFDKTMKISDRKAVLEAKCDAPLPEGKWTVKETLLDASGKEIDSRSFDFPVKKQAWEGCRAGEDDGSFVPSPYEPIKIMDKALSVLNRTYKINDLGWPESITSDGEELLSAPIRLELYAGGKPVQLTPKSLDWSDKKNGKVSWTAKSEGAGILFTVKNTLEYDGTVFTELSLAPQAGEAAVDSLNFVADFKEFVNMAKVFRGSNYAGGGTFRINDDMKGVIWDSAQTRPIPGVAGTFNPAVYIGNPDKGLWWFGDSDQGWILDDAKSSGRIERTTEGKIRLTQLLVNKQSKITAPRTIKFVLQAVPAKPMPANKREIEWGPQIIWGHGGWADGYYTFGYDTKEQWEAFSKWDWASRALYVATNLIGPGLQGFPTYAGEWTGDSDYMKFTKGRQQLNLLTKEGTFKNAAGLEFKDNLELKISGYVLGDTVKSLVDCRAYYYDQGVKFGKLRGFWWDMDTIWPIYKPELGFGYVRDDGTRQPSFNFCAMREMYKRLYQIAWQNNVEPIQWHYADGYYGSFLTGAWLVEGYYYMFSRNVNLIEGAPRDFWMTVSGKHLGTTAQMRSNFYELGLENPFADPRPHRAAMTVCLLNDFGGYGFNDGLRNIVLAKMRGEGFFDPSVTSVRHWEKKIAEFAEFKAVSPDADVLVTAYLLPENKIMVAVGNMSRTPTDGTIMLRPKALLGDKANARAMRIRDLETGLKPWMPEPKTDTLECGIFAGGHDFRLLILE